VRDAVRRKRPELWDNQTRVLHHDNAPAHASLLIRSYLTKYQTSFVSHPPYSLNLATADIFRKNSVRELHAITDSASRKLSSSERNVRNGVSPVEETALKGTMLTMLKK
jgi:hypothetical protein